jgi:hypothetical protein
MADSPRWGHYDEHPVFTPPDDPETAIWRYIDFAKLVSLLESRSLFFARAESLNDPFEGSYSQFNVMNRTKVSMEIPMDQLARMAEIYHQFTKWTFVNCWNMSSHESAALWGLYVPPTGGVAVRSTFDRLRRAFGSTEPLEEVDPTPRIHIGQVKYVDYETDWMPEGNSMWPFVHKRHSFEFEREIRALYQWVPAEAAKDGDVGHLDFSKPVIPGFSFAVDLDLLVERIYVSPTAPDWFAGLVSDVCSRYGLGATVEQSSLAASPVY